MSWFIKHYLHNLQTQLVSNTFILNDQGTHLFRLRALKILLATLARLISKNLTALITGLRSAVTRSILGNSDDLTAVGKLLTDLEGRRTTVIGTVAVFGLLPVAAPATVDAVVVVGVHAGGWCSGGGGGGN